MDKPSFFSLSRAFFKNYVVSFVAEDEPDKDIEAGTAKALSMQTDAAQALPQAEDDDRIFEKRSIFNEPIFDTLCCNACIAGIEIVLYCGYTLQDMYF